MSPPVYNDDKRTDILIPCKGWTETLDDRCYVDCRERRFHKFYWAKKEVLRRFGLIVTYSYKIVTYLFKYVVRIRCSNI